MVSVEVFDQRRPGRRDPDSSFGTLTISVADTLDLAAGGHGECVSVCDDRRIPFFILIYNLY